MTFHNMVLFFYYEGLLAHHKITNPPWLSVIAYLVYSQLPSISGSCLLYLHPKDAAYHNDKGPI